MSRIFVVIGVLLVLVASCSKARNSIKNDTKVSEIKLPGDFADCLLADFDGDGLNEIFAMTIDSIGGPDDDSMYPRKGAIAHYSNGGFGDPVTFDLPPEAIVFDSGDIDSDGNPEILYLAGDGLYAMDYDKAAVSSPEKIISQNTVFMVPTARSVSYWDIFKSGPELSHNYLLLPCFKGITVYEINRGSIDSIGTITIHHRAGANSGIISETRQLNYLTYSCTLPTIEIADYNGDAIDDIFVISPSRIAIYQGVMGDGFSKVPSYIFKPYNETPEQLLNAGIQFRVQDINHDGRSDIIVSRSRGGVIKFQSDIEVYYCKSRGGYDEKPSFSRHITQAAGSAYLCDFNADNRADLAIPELQLGIVPLMKMLILNKLDMTLEIFTQQGGGQYPSEPNLKKYIAATVDINAGNISYDNKLSLAGDFNGDHFTDFLIDSGKGHLQIYYGAAGSVLSSEPNWNGYIPPALSMITTDINGDGKDEILAFNAQGSADTRLIRVVWVQ